MRDKTPFWAAAALLILALPTAAGAISAEQQEEVLRQVERQAPRMSQDALQIWHLAELGYQENESAALLQGTLRDAGFTVEAGVAGIPTAFIASFRQGEGPVIGLLAEYDALPAMSQQAVPQQALGQSDNNAGHACGHNLLGAASVAAAIAVRNWMVSNGVAGEIRVYGTPAEEGGSGKVYMVRAGLFGDVDAVLHWHPGDANVVNNASTLANISGKFRFSGTAAHAAIAPERGRSALDGVEVMNVAVNYMREHIPSDARIHYAISAGGGAPNVVPARAESYYYVRHSDPETVRSVMRRVQKAAEGAALATETSVSFEATGGVYPTLANDTLAAVMSAQLSRVGAPHWDAQEMDWARQLGASLADPRDLAQVSQIAPINSNPGSASTDVADVSWNIPTIGVTTATWVPGTVAHSWQAVAASGHSIGLKGSVTAASVLALTAAELFTRPDVIASAQEELLRRRGSQFQYSAMLGDRAPPLDYRSATGNTP